jgi:murein DD-endopeptidase MepM/ murein hydrolase activator NlpD
MPTIPIPGAALPLEGLLSFDYQRSETHVHNGIDLPAPIGTQVLAARSGLVKYATRAWQQGFTGYGNVVVIEQDDGTFALYAHLEEPLVNAGEPVHEGEPIGLVGTSQYSAPDHVSHFARNGAHLHFEISATPYPQESTAPRLDPVAWLKSEGARVAAVPFGRERAQGLELGSLSSEPQSPSSHCSGSKDGSHES